MYNCTSDEHADVVGVRVDYGGSALKSLVFRLRYRGVPRCEARSARPTCCQHLDVGGEKTH